MTDTTPQAATAVSARPRNRRQFQALFSNTIPFKATLDLPSLADGKGVNATIAVPGAVLGDFVMVSISVDEAGFVASAYVSAANVVTIRFQNESESTTDVASCTVKGLCLSPSSQVFY